MKYHHTNHRLTPTLVATLIGTLLIIYNIAFPNVGHATEAYLLNLGFTASSYQESTNNDINAAVSVLIQKIARKYFSESKARYFDNFAEMATAMKNGKIQVLCGPPEEFLAMRNRTPLTPILITSSSSGPETELLLLVRKDSGIRSLSDLKGKSIVMPHQTPVNNMFHIWIETLLMREGYGSIAVFFSSVKESRIISRGIMPVFFRQAAACVVTRHIFNLTSELNPQIGRELVPIARMSKLSQGIISIDRRVPNEIKNKVIQAFLNLPESPDGKQLLMLFQVSKIIPFRPEYLDATEALFNEHQRLKARFARRQRMH